MSESVIRSMQKDWGIWMRAVTVTAVVLAVVFSALVMSPETDHPILPDQYTVISMVDAGVTDGGAVQPARETKCHYGHSCMPVILPSNDLDSMRFDSPPELSGVAGYPRTVAGGMHFHPPRILSEV